LPTSPDCGLEWLGEQGLIQIVAVEEQLVLMLVPGVLGASALATV
jgi:hypothetical protein